jgi:thioredoxin 1
LDNTGHDVIGEEAFMAGARNLVLALMGVLVAGCAQPPAVDGGASSQREPAAASGDTAQKKTEPKKEAKPMSEAAVEINDDNFVEITKSGVALVDFWATWCPPCRMQGPIVDKIAAQYKGKAVIGKLNVDDSQAVASKFGVHSIPTLIIFKDGQEVQRLVGLQTEQKLQSVIDAEIGG